MPRDAASCFFPPRGRAPTYDAKSIKVTQRKSLENLYQGQGLRQGNFPEGKQMLQLGMDIYETRRANLLALIQSSYGGKFVNFADATDLSPSYVSRLFMKSDTHRRNIGEAVARRIEKFCGLEDGALDRPPQSQVIQALPPPLVQKINSYRSLISIERFDVAGSMGPGTEPPDFNSVVDSMTLDAAWVRQNLVYTSIDNIKLISGRGDSMSPTIRNGDPLLVDVGITAVECDAIYFFMMAGQLHIKRIQRHLDGLSILSDNERYRSIEVAAGRESELTIFAQVIYIWNGHKS
ncbi:S24 family peptidase [Pseudomonas aeruginosa]|uniref:S24 family peptidase n=1 Tax=Pseudomonas aeruginosa TaxID=287 RepID=UPI001ED9B997|nr:S24 family peptidase [Pseudomonas aeruginosa]